MVEVSLADVVVMTEVAVPSAVFSVSLPSSLEQPARTRPETAAAAAIDATRREIVMPMVRFLSVGPRRVGGTLCSGSPVLRRAIRSGWVP